MYNMKEKTSKVTDSLILGEVAQGKELRSEIMKILQMLKLLKMMISFGQKKITQTLLNLIPQQFRLRN